MILRDDHIALRARAGDILKQCPEWYHSIELAPGIVTPGRAPLSTWERTLEQLHLPSLRGKSVLDIGAYDGFFSFAAERLGAARVVALDEHVWATDMAAYLAEWRVAKAAGVAISAPRESRHWRPHELPGRRPFEAAHAMFESKVEAVVGNFMTMDISALGKFDVVLFLGILYHMEEPLPAMRRVASLLKPGGFLGIETEAMELAGAPDAALFEFFPTNELNNDTANWWAPNARGIEALAKAIGLERFHIFTAPPRQTRAQAVRARIARERVRYRAVAHAFAPNVGT